MIATYAACKFVHVYSYSRLLVHGPRIRGGGGGELRYKRAEIPQGLQTDFTRLHETQSMPTPNPRPQPELEALIHTQTDIARQTVL